MIVKRLADIVIAFFRTIPADLRKTVIAAFFRLFYYLSPRHRLIAAYNLRRAFPEKSDDEIMTIVQGVYLNMAIVTAEFFDIPRLTKERIARCVDAEGLENCTRALEKGKGVLLFGAHFSNWELAAAAVSLLVKPGVAIYRPLDSPFLEQLVLRVRSATGNVPLAKEHAMRAMLRALKQNGILGILIDQNMDWYEGVFVDYFGRPACTTDGLAHLALHTEAPVLPAWIARQPDGRYRFVIGPEVEVIRTGDRDADIKANTQHFTKMIEEIVRQYPDQWLWVHQRWKTPHYQARRKK